MEPDRNPQFPSTEKEFVKEAENRDFSAGF